MFKAKSFTLILGASTLFFTVAIHADGFIKKEIYSFKDANGNVVFTDRQPDKKQLFKTKTIEAANSSGNSTQISHNNYASQNSNTQLDYSINNIESPQTIRVIVENGNISSKKAYKKKRSLKRCKSYKKKLTYYSDKMKSGYKNSEYKKLETNRKKYKNLLFKNCKTKTFND